MTATGHGYDRYLAPPREKRRGIAFCMSGGGYRAALFHLGALRRLNELGILSKVATFTSVSGGSIMAAQLATFLAKLDPRPEPGKTIPSFEAGVAEPMRAFAGTDVRTRAALARLHPRNWLEPGAPSEALAASYARGPAPGRLSDLPERPRFVFLATDMRFRAQWAFDTGRREVGSPAAGYRPLADWTLAQAVAASSCVPGAFGAVVAENDPATLSAGEYGDSDRDELVRKIDLSDGGIYDNLGLEPVWRDHAVLLVSDAAPSFKPDPKVGWLWRGLRYGVTLLEQATDVRKRWLVSSFIKNEFEGAYWGIASRPASYEHDPSAYDPALPVYPERLIRDFIAPIRIDLDVFSEGEIAVLENHGYLMAEIALKRHASQLADGEWSPPELPHPDWMTDEKVERALAGSGKTHMFFRPRTKP
jgi:NTE family protein